MPKRHSKSHFVSASFLRVFQYLCYSGLCVALLNQLLFYQKDMSSSSSLTILSTRTPPCLRKESQHIHSKYSGPLTLNDISFTIVPSTNTKSDFHNIRKSWLQDIQQNPKSYMFLSEHPNSSMPCLKQEAKNLNLCCITTNFINLVSTTWFPDRKWYILANDQTYYYVEHLMVHLNDLDSSQPILVGGESYTFLDQLGQHDSSLAITFLDGSGGYVFSRALIELLKMNVGLFQKYCKDSEDYEKALGMILKQLNVCLVSFPGFLSQMPASPQTLRFKFQKSSLLSSWKASTQPTSPFHISNMPVIYYLGSSHNAPRISSSLTKESLLLESEPLTLARSFPILPSERTLLSFISSLSIFEAKDSPESLALDLMETIILEEMVLVFKGIHQIFFMDTPNILNDGHILNYLGELELLRRLGVNIMFARDKSDDSENDHFENLAYVVHGGILTFSNLRSLDSRAGFNSPKLQQPSKWVYFPQYYQNDRQSLAIGQRKPMKEIVLMLRNRKSYQLLQPSIQSGLSQLGLLPDFSFMLSKPLKQLGQSLKPFYEDGIVSPVGFIAESLKKDILFLYSKSNTIDPNLFHQLIQGSRLQELSQCWEDMVLEGMREWSLGSLRALFSSDDAHNYLEKIYKDLLNLVYLFRVTIVDDLEMHQMLVMLNVPHVIYSQNIFVEAMVKDSFETWTKGISTSRFASSLRQAMIEAVSLLSIAERSH